MMITKLFRPFAFFMILVFAACTHNSQQKPAANVEMDGIEYLIREGGIGYKVIDNEVDYSQGHHFMVTMFIANKSSEQLSFDSTTFKLLDADGREISLSTNEDNPMNITTEVLYKTSINTGASEECVLAFPVNEPGDYKLKITSPKSQRHKIISF